MLKIDNDRVANVNLTELIRSRRSISSFRPDPIPPGTIETLLETAVYAPNHHLTEPWRFVYMTGASVAAYAAIRRDMAMPGFMKMDPAVRELAANGTYHKFAAVPAYLVVIMGINSRPDIADEDYAACAALIQNFLLLAWAQGIGSCWKTLKDDIRLKTFVGLQENERSAGIIHLGYPAEIPASQRKSVLSRLTYLS